MGFNAIGLIPFRGINLAQANFEELAAGLQRESIAVNDLDGLTFQIKSGVFRPQQEQQDEQQRE